jgi:RNA polymerase sigma-70 factor (ECF subfamily)
VDELTRLAVAARRGDPAVIAAFIRASQNEVWSVCAYLVDQDSADDLTQETYLRVFRALPKFRQQSSARTWLLTITRRVCMDELRRRLRRRRRETALPHPAEHPAQPGDTQQVEVRELLNQLPHDRRTAFVLTQVLGLSYQQAGHICHCPPGTIGSRVARARTDLIDALGLTDEIARHTDTEARPDAMG